MLLPHVHSSVRSWWATSSADVTPLPAIFLICTSTHASLAGVSRSRPVIKDAAECGHLRWWLMSKEGQRGVEESRGVHVVVVLSEQLVVFVHAPAVDVAFGYAGRTIVSEPPITMVVL